MTDAEMIWKVGAAVSWLLTLYLLIRKAGGKPEPREISPQPLTVRPDLPGHDLYAPKAHVHPQYMMRGDCDAKHMADERREDARANEIKVEIRLLGVKIDEFNKLAEERARQTHLRINEVEGVANQLKGKLDLHLQHHHGDPK